MKITFLVGNGFDLNLGLDTNYSDFLKEYKKNKDTDNEIIQYFKNEVLSQQNLWSNAEEAFGVVTKNFLEKGYDAEAYCDCHEDFCNNLASYLINQEQRINYSEQGLVLIKNLASGLLGYKKSFRENERNQIESTESTIGNGLNFNFINFNYTQTLDLCLESLKKNLHLLGKRNGYSSSIGTIIHVHGTVHRDMVLGVNDLSQILEPTIFEGFGDEYISQVIKQRTNELNGDNIDRKALELLNSSDIIYIYGMSTGITDKLWWQRICELMKSNKKVHLFIHKYNAPQEGLLMRRIISYINEERRAFAAYSDFDDVTKTEIENRIHIDRSNIFIGLKGVVNNTPKVS